MLLASIVGASFAAVFTWSGQAMSQLVTFAPNTPAKAGDVNGNFAQLKTWVEQKLGTVGNANITSTGTVTVTSAGGLHVNGPIVSRSQNGIHDVWIQGGNAGGGERNLALIGSDEDSGDTLYVNWDGEYSGGTEIQSNLKVRGVIDIGLERVVCENLTSGSSCSCPSGKRLLGGGAFCSDDNDHINTAWADSITSYQAWCENSAGANKNLKISILCARL